MTSKVILVTGASGFVGQALVNRLASVQHYVVKPVFRRKTGDVKNAVFIDDFNAKTDWSESLVGVDCVVHLAARVHQMSESKEAASLYHQTNVEATLNLAKQALSAGVKRFVYLSSVKVNGDFCRRALDEISPLYPSDAYGESKLAAEKALSSLLQGALMELTILRPCLVYGPGVKANFLALMKWLNRGCPLPLGSIRNQRSLVFVGNLVDLIAHSIEHKNAAGEIFCVADQEVVSTPELLRKIANSLGVKPRLVKVPLSLLHLVAALSGKREAILRLTESLYFTTEKAAKTLEWKPPFTMDEGLKITADWFKNAGPLR